MSFKLDNYEEGLRMAKPTFLGQKSIRPPGAFGALRSITIPAQTIPPINTNIQFDLLPTFQLSKHPGLAAIKSEKLPENFNWRENGDVNKRRNLATPGNQMLCGSCWAISTAGIVADNHVIAGTVNWKPNLSTTWCLSCYPQHKCQGGNPAKLFQDISEHGIATDNCVDYSWCSENDACSGAATQHFEGKENIDLSTLIPSCGCYDAKVEHYLYTIDPPTSLSIGRGDLTESNFADTVKKHIFAYGPVQGGYLVFKNFRSGVFTKMNGGVYLETGVYDEGNLRFDDSQTTPGNYIGSHAVAIIGWGVEKGILIDNKGTKADVNYWYCRNSWTEKWGDGGYFKMAMYPHNKLSQFDKMVQLATPKGNMVSGGIVLIKASKPPKLQTLAQLSKKFTDLRKKHENDFYSSEPKPVGKIGEESGEKSTIVYNYKKIFILIFILGLILGMLGIIIYFRKKSKTT